MFYVILLGLVGTTTAILLKEAQPSEPKQERMAETMKKLTAKNQKDQFVCTQLDERYAHYVFENGVNTISILVGPEYITVNAQRAKTQQPLLDVRFDVNRQVYTEKKISELLIKKDRDRKHIEQFLAWVVVNFQPEKKRMLYQNSKSYTALIAELEDARRYNKLTAPIDHAFSQITPGLGYLLEHKEYIADVEYEHQVKETIIRDLRNLLEDFIRLDRQQKEKFEHETLSRLITIQERVTHIRKHIDRTREFDLRKTLSTIDERYEH